MELTTILENALATQLVGTVSLVLGWKILKGRISDAIRAKVSEIIGELMTEVVENPEKLKPVLDALVKQGFKSAGIENVGKMGRVKFGSLSVPGEVVQMGLPLIQSLMKRFSGSAAEKAAETVFG